MISPLAAYLLSSSPAISPFTIRLFLRLLGEFDLRKPKVWNGHDLAKLWGWPKWEIEKALKELEEVGIMEEMGDLKSSLVRNGSVLRLREEMIFSGGELGEWLKESREMRERGSLVLTHGRNWRALLLTKGMIGALPDSTDPDPEPAEATS